jgi:hypothetical protein
VVNTVAGTWFSAVGSLIVIPGVAVIQRCVRREQGAQRGQRRTAGLIPDWLGFQHLYATPRSWVRDLPVDTLAYLLAIASEGAEIPSR